MYKLAIPPNSDGYTEHEPEDEVIYVALDGGAGRYRLDKLGATRMIDVQWTLDREQYQYWRAFFNTGTMRGSLPFLLDVLSEDGNGVVECQCNFVPGSVQLPTQSGFMYVQQATIEVIPVPRDTEADLILITMGPGSDDVVNELANLANVIMPGDFV